MTIKLNGVAKETSAQTVAQLLEENNLRSDGLAVAKNGAVVRRADHASTPLHESDEIEIIRAVQGG